MRPISPAPETKTRFVRLVGRRPTGTPAGIGCRRNPPLFLTHDLKLRREGLCGNGCTKDKIMDTPPDLSIYAGIPAGLGAVRPVRQLFAGLEA